MPRTTQSKRGSIAIHLLHILLPFIFLILATIMVINYKHTKTIMTENTFSELQKESDYYTKVIDGWNSNILASLQSVQTTLENVSFASDEEELKYLSQTLTLQESIPNGIYEGSSDGTYLDGSGWVPDADYIVTERDWYKDGLDHSKFTFGTPYMDANTNSFIVSASTLLDRADKKQRVAACDIELSDICQQVSDMDVMSSESGYAFLVDTSSNVILAHKNAELAGTEISTTMSDPYLANIASHCNVEKRSVFDIPSGSDSYLTVLQPVPDTTWILILSVSSKELFSSLKRMRILYITIAILAILATGFVVAKLVRQTIMPVVTLTHVITQLTSGDLTVNIHPNGNNEITTMSCALRDYVYNMHHVISDIVNISEQLDAEALTCKESSQTLSNTATVQATSMGDMRMNVEQLAFAVNEIAENATTLAQVVDSTRSSSETAHSNIQNAVTIANQGFTDMQQVQTKMDSIVSEIEVLSHVVSEVGNSTEEINSIIQLIGEIASQTNLLSLNASIEAARAGEAGKGFAVVATEIGNLADVSANSVSQISSIISKVNSLVTDMITKTQSSVHTIQDNAVSVEEACQTFGKIVDDISITSDLMDSMLQEIQQVNDVATNMAAVAEQQSASASIISENIDTLSAHSEQIAEESRQVEACASVMSDAAINLSEHMKNFKLHKTDVQPSDT